MGGQGWFQGLDNATGANPLIGQPFNLAFVHGVGIEILTAEGLDFTVTRVGNAAMVKRDHKPVIVVDRGTRGAAHCIGAVPQDVIRALQKPIFADTDLFAFSVGMLDDGEPLTFHGFAGGF